MILEPKIIKSATVSTVSPSICHEVMGLDASINKARGGDGITVELFQILKDDAVTVLHSICQQNSAVVTGLEKISFHAKPKEGQCQ